MAEVVHRPGSSVGTLPAGAGKGSMYRPSPQGIQHGLLRAHAVQTIQADPQTLYTLWRRVELAPRWMEFVIAAEPKSDTRTHWIMGDPEEPNGRRIEYDTEITADEPGRRIAWKSLNTDINETGEVLFEPAPGGRGTRVTLLESVRVPGGRLGTAAATVAKRSPSQIVIEDLRHFKQLAETGEIPNVTRNPHGPRGLVGSFKRRMYGETNPTPPGTTDSARG